MGGGNGGSITLQATTGNLQINNNFDVSGQVNGNGGSIKLVSGSTTDALFIMNPAGNNYVFGTLSANGGSNSGNGGDITIQGPAGLGIFYNGGLSVSTNSGNGGSITLDASSTGTILIDSSVTNITANGAGGNGNGGSITINCAQLNYGSPFSLSANASTSGVGNGGTISVTAASQNFFLDSTGFSILAQGGSVSGNGGSISVKATGISATMSTASLDASPLAGNSNGASYSFIATTNVLISSNLSANGLGSGNGGSIRIESNAVSAAFDIGNPSLGANGTGDGSGTGPNQGLISANSGSAGGSGGSIVVINHGNGGITLDDSAYVSASAGSSGVGNGGTIVLAANDTNSAGPINVLNVSGPIIVSGAGADSNGGTIVLAGSFLNTNAGLPLIANGNGAGAAGTVVLTASSPTAFITIVPNSGSNANTFSIATLGQGLVAPTPLAYAGVSSGFAVGSGAGSQGATLVFPANGIFVNSGAGINLDISGLTYSSSLSSIPSVMANSRGANISLVANQNLNNGVDPNTPASSGNGSLITLMLSFRLFWTPVVLAMVTVASSI